MITKIQWGIGSPGKLWTGDVPVAGTIVDAKIIERTCACGASTRKLRAHPVAISAEGIAALEIPTLFLTAGGVGSIYNDPELDCRLTVWNWSHRNGGHVVVNPLAVIGGYVGDDPDDPLHRLPQSKAGFRWVCTYSGSTLSGQIERGAPNCSTRKKRLLALATAGDEAGMLAMLPECREWITEHVQWVTLLLSVPSCADGVLDTSAPLDLPAEWQAALRGES